MPNEKVKKKEYPVFALTDFKNFEALFAKLCAQKENPFYLRLSQNTRDFINVFTAGTVVGKNSKVSFCNDCNNIIQQPDLYNQLSAFYGNQRFESQLSAVTKRFLEEASPILNISTESLKNAELVRIQWLNLSVLIDLYPQEIRRIIRKSSLQAWVEAFVVALALVVFLRTFFFQIYKIPTTSMLRTLAPGDKIFVSKLVYGPKVPFTPLRLPGFRKPERGEVVVFIPPKDRNKAYIKRLIGMPGDRVLIKDGNVYLNGKIMVDPRVARNYYYNQGEYGKEQKEIIVPAGYYFFLGDNSINSQDSRYWGFANEKDIIGKAIFIWWPFDRIGMIE
ncbi:MAG: signal peptidase I [Candidatus Omnitrophota bacterium]